MSKPRATARGGFRAHSDQSAEEPSTSEPENMPSRSALKSFVRQFVENNRAASLATTDDDGTPHVAIVYCIMRHDLRVYFSTRVEGRKFANLLSQRLIAMAFYHEKSLETVQLSGIARRVDDLITEQSIMHSLMKMRYDDPNWPPPPMQLFERGATNELAVIEVVPTELTFATFKTSRIGRYQPFFYRVL